ncbi:MAG: hypothetical protein FWB92_11420, partial [Oscillospiraceae bacterium]|nr:hypothetical protein [Oscillospiraceae bacterium]
FYAMTRDTVFKLMFVNHPELLRKLVAEFLELKLSDITDILQSHSIRRACQFGTHTHKARA